MAESPDVSIVVPVYNEEDNLSVLHVQITAAMEDIGCVWEVVYVDDRSEDSGWEKMLEIARNDSAHVRLLRLRRNFGQTAALAAGFDHARGRLVVPLDADLQNDPADTGKMIAKLDEGYDVVSGWRRDRQDPFLSRRLPSMIANRLISFITGVRLHDYGCSLKVYRRHIIQDVHLYGEMHRFLPALAVLAGARVCEVPVNHRARAAGQSKYGLGRTLHVMLDLITVKFLLKYATQPMQIFGRWGFLSLVTGILFFLVMVWRKFLPPYEDITGTPWLYLSIFFLLGGLQLIGLGLLGEINVRTYHETQQKPIYALSDDSDERRGVS